MFVANFLLQIGVLRLEPGLLPFHQHPLGDVHEHRARVGAARVGIGPPLNPNRLAVIPAAQFEDDAAGVRPAPNGFERLAQTALGVGRLGHEILPVSSGNLFGLDAENPHGGAIGPDETGIKTFIHVGNGRLIEKVTESLLALLALAMQTVEGTQALQFHASTAREGFHH